MSTLHRPRGRVVLFWILTAPLVFQLTYFVVEQLGGLGSPGEVATIYLLAQVAYLMLLAGMLWLGRAYRRWITSLATA